MKPENFIDNLITQLKKNPGSTREFSVIPPEFMPQAKLAKSLLSLPKKSVPEPVMQRKFMLAPLPARSATFVLKLSRFMAVGVSVMVLVLVGFTAYATSNALPGQKLFKIKRAAEQIQLSLTSDPVKKANLQLSFTQRRLAEAQTIFSDPVQNNDLELAALNELAGQTQTTVNEVKSIAASQKISSPLVASLQDVATKQTTLLSQVKNETAAKEAPPAVLAQAEAGQAQVNEMIKIIAASSDESPAAFSTSSSSTLITILPSATSSPEKINPATTSTSSALTAKKPEPEKHVTGDGDQSQVDVQPADPNTAIGTFILENPSSQAK